MSHRQQLQAASPACELSQVPSELTESLLAKKCLPCEGGIPRLGPAEIATQLPLVPGWQVSDDNKMISRSWRARNFVSAMEQLNALADMAEAEQHHPDLHLTSYRHIRVDLWTHAIDGLSENDLILAAKINQWLQKQSIT
ncbi:4a-hydroxytetrahydrobiopterin dehydratase [Planctopirus hydrillae]|uniref:4a-hydroxytetrahydrobiopterin dehydratase n=1 Tax=Planctopirus hydrillae TaxID=1841610 RepID=A0A1C3EN08_9PLAN|nr:4a-hydroxytetrahydrobiopterin dehydratase [Planctopirus hydrillae]ODA34626.1 pterin-4-alpha-carbinolamine dehydratase [Planctopirus hydrillae]